MMSRLSKYTWKETDEKDIKLSRDIAAPTNPEFAEAPMVRRGGAAANSRKMAWLYSTCTGATWVTSGNPHTHAVFCVHRLLPVLDCVFFSAVFSAVVACLFVSSSLLLSSLLLSSSSNLSHTSCLLCSGFSRRSSPLLSCLSICLSLFLSLSFGREPIHFAITADAFLTC